MNQKIRSRSRLNAEDQALPRCKHCLPQDGKSGNGVAPALACAAEPKDKQFERVPNQTDGVTNSSKNKKRKMELDANAGSVAKMLDQVAADKYPWLLKKHGDSKEDLDSDSRAGDWSSPDRAAGPDTPSDAASPDSDSDFACAECAALGWCQHCGQSLPTTRNVATSTRARRNPTLRTSTRAHGSHGAR